MMNNERKTKTNVLKNRCGEVLLYFLTKSEVIKWKAGFESEGAVGNAGDSTRGDVHMHMQSMHIITQRLIAR